MARNDEPRRIDVVDVGYFRMRLVRKGWAVPCAIESENGAWRVVVDGLVGGWVQDPAVDEAIMRVWTSGAMIARWEYLDLLALKERMESEGRDHPCLDPNRPMDPMTLPVIQARDIARRPRPIGRSEGET